jgi:hypothetical protein
VDKSHITIVQTLLKAGANINAAAKVRIMSNPCLNGGGKNEPSTTPLYRLSATYTTDILPDMQSPSVVYYTGAVRLPHYALLNKPHTSIKFCLLARLRMDTLLSTSPLIEGGVLSSKPS